MKMDLPLLTMYEKAAQNAMRGAGRETLARARDLSPTATGASDKTGFVAVDDLTVQVGFTSLVSRLQHENLEYQHPDGGVAKFLETAADEIDMEARAAAALRGELGG